MDRDENIIYCKYCRRKQKVILGDPGYYCSVCNRVLLEYNREAENTEKYIK